MFGSRVRTAADRAPHKGARSAAALIVLAALTVAACTGGTATVPGGGAVTATTAPVASLPTPPAGCTSPRVSANVASIEDLEAAFKEGGISNAGRWAEEVDEYRPYPVDPSWAKLSKELGKYNVDPAVFDAIVSCLTT